MPDHVLSKEEREDISASNLVAADWKRLNPQTWTPQHVAFIKAAAEQPEVERVLVNAAIKKELCRVEDKKQHAWMAKVRPWYGHHDHIHVRLRCPADSPNCRHSSRYPAATGAAPRSWTSGSPTRSCIRRESRGRRRRQTMLADLPPACKDVLDAADQARPASPPKTA